MNRQPRSHVLAGLIGLLIVVCGVLTGVVLVPGDRAATWSSQAATVTTSQWVLNAVLLIIVLIILVGVFCLPRLVSGNKMSRAAWDFFSVCTVATGAVGSLLLSLVLNAGIWVHAVDAGVLANEGTRATGPWQGIHLVLAVGSLFAVLVMGIRWWLANRKVAEAV